MPTDDSIAHFFSVSLPTRLASDINGLYSTAGAIAFSISGAGKWTLRFSSDEPVINEFQNEAELRLWFTRDAFDQWLNNELDVAAAVASGAVKARGDVHLLEALGSILSGGSTSLGWDAG